MRTARLFAFAGALLCATASVSQAKAADETATIPLASAAQPSRVLPLGGALKTRRSWLAYKARFVTDQGRVVDTGNASISHSEGQGYAMLLAVAADDRASFDRIWNWTRANMMVRDDQLIAWRWEPARRPAVSDMNNASDGDILVAWALLEAADLWSDVSYRVAARRIAVEVSRKVILFETKLGALLLPAVAGFHADDRADGPVVNLSYYVFPAFQRLEAVAPEVDWAGLTQTGLGLLDATRATSRSLPADWLALGGSRVRPADGFAPRFSYDAVRVPLYLAWAGIGEREQYAPFLAWAARGAGAPAVVDIASGKDVGAFSGSGAAAIGALVACASDGSAPPADATADRASEDYYPATLRLLALLAAQMRYPSCSPK